MKTLFHDQWRDKHELKPNGEIFFDSDRKRMTMIYKTEVNGAEETWAYMKGSPESILSHCDRIMIDGKVEHLSAEYYKEILDANLELANKAFRVLGMAKRKRANDDADFSIEHVENDMIFLGLSAMIDPPRDEVKKAVEKCKNAGIRIIMITGDQKNTAMAIAQDLDLKPYEDAFYTAYTAAELEQMSEEDFKKVVKDLDVCARASPSIKRKIITTLQEDYNHVVSMTGDGVNDAPALKKADIGVAMGITGTDVAREASDMILTDDNFATIVSAVEEGRQIYDNMKSFIRYMLSSNFDEILVVLVATVFLGFPSPYLALGILWINLMTDGLPAIALAMDPGDKNIMTRKPKGKESSMMNEIILFSLIAGVISFAATMILFSWALNSGASVRTARTYALTVSVIFELFQVFVTRTPEGKSVFRHNPFNNGFLILAVGIAFGGQLFIMYVPAAADVFEMSPLGLLDWLRMLGIVIVGIIVLDIAKLLQAAAKPSKK